MANVFLNYSSPPTLDKTFAVINEMVANSIIENYALGGAMAVLFYMEPDTTFDVDIFCVVASTEEKALVIVSPIYQYLRGKGYAPDGEGISIEGFRVQFLPVFNDLTLEAVTHANVLEYRGVPVRVMTPEYLVAIMLQTGRLKDFARIARFVKEEVFDRVSLLEILSRHGLESKVKELLRLERRVRT